MIKHDFADVFADVCVNVIVIQRKAEQSPFQWRIVSVFVNVFWQCISSSVNYEKIWITGFAAYLSGSQ